jgi:hypothetical protein
MRDDRLRLVVVTDSPGLKRKVLEILAEPEKLT